MRINSVTVHNALLSDDDVRDNDPWGGQIPFADLQDFAWDVSRVAVVNALRTVAQQAGSGGPTSGELLALADSIAAVAGV